VTVIRLPHTGEHCRFSATVETVVQTGRRVRVEQRLDLTDSDGTPLSSSILALVVPDSRAAARSPKREPEFPQLDADELAKFSLRRDEGFRYALVSGDFNPSHWITPFAKLTGLDGVIAHGFDLMARISHTLIALKAQGDPRRLRFLDVTFRRPVVLPASLRLLGKQDESSTKDQNRLLLWLTQEASAAACISGYAEIGT
jgi:acyl dehydratase